LIDDAFHFSNDISCAACAYELFYTESLLSIYFCSNEFCDDMSYQNQILAFEIEFVPPEYYISMTIRY